MRWLNRKSAANGGLTLIGEGSVFSGQLEAGADIRIEGEVRGDIRSAGEVTIGQGGFVRSDLTARDIVIAGRMEGRVIAERSLRITATGRLAGTVQAATLIIEPGAVFQGSSEMIEALPEPDLSCVVV